VGSSKSSIAKPVRAWLGWYRPQRLPFPVRPDSCNQVVYHAAVHRVKPDLFRATSAQMRPLPVDPSALFPAVPEDTSDISAYRSPLTFSAPTASYELAATPESAELAVASFPMAPVYVRAEVFLRARQGEAAVAEFQKILRHPGYWAIALLGFWLISASREHTLSPVTRPKPARSTKIS
jgi:hypothetical protein